MESGEIYLGLNATGLGGEITTATVAAVSEQKQQPTVGRVKDGSRELHLKDIPHSDCRYRY